MPRIYTDKGPIAQLLQLYKAREAGVRESDLIDIGAVWKFERMGWSIFCPSEDRTRLITGTGIDAVKALGLAEARETTDEWLERLDEEAREGARPYPTGMSLRAYFTAAAIPAAVSLYMAGHYEESDFAVDAIGRCAVQIADGALRALGEESA